MKQAQGSTLRVVAALLQRDGRLLVQQRPAHKPQPLLWEFPGGKIEAGESAQDALCRECYEELCAQIDVLQLARHVTHDYGDFRVDLQLFWARLQSHSPAPRPLHAVQLRWCAPAELLDLEFLPADVAIVRALSAQEL